MLRLGGDDLPIVVMPEAGAALLGWVVDGTHILRPARPEAVMNGDVHGLSCFPLVPFCNRIANGRFLWRGVEHQLDRNFGDHPHAIHGLGWQRAWQVLSASEGKVILMLEHDGATTQARHWPFPFSAVLSYAYTGDKLNVALAVINRHTEPAPLGIGLHPYFPRRSDVTLQFRAAGVWINSMDSLPARYATVPSEWDHTNPRTAGSLSMDNCFTAWNRRAHIAGIAGGIAIEADMAFRHLQVYTPRGEDFFCVVPVSHVPNALNRADLHAGQAMHVVQPGATLSGAITIGRAPASGQREFQH